MTDADEFTAILAAFPMTSAQVQALHRRADALLGKAQNGPPLGAADGTISPREWYQLRAFVRALWSLYLAATYIETDTAAPDDPRAMDDDIPF